MSWWWNGRHVRFRCVWRNPCGFKSHSGHYLFVGKVGQKYTVYGISQKLARNSMRYDELKFLAGVLGYNIKFEKQINE